MGRFDSAGGDVAVPYFVGGCQAFGDVGMLFGDVVFLAGVGGHVVQFVSLASIDEAVLLGSHGTGCHVGFAEPVLVGEDHAIGPILGVAMQEGHKAAAVLGQRLWHGYVAHVEDRGEEIDVGGDLGDSGSGVDMVRPADEEGDADTAFVDLCFPAPHATVVAMLPRSFGSGCGHVWAVVAGEDDNGVVRQFQVVERGEDSCQVVVDVFDHGVDAGGSVVETTVGVLGEVLLGHLVGMVGGVVGQVAEEGSVVVVLDEGECGVGEDVGDVAFGLDRFAVLFDGSVEVVFPGATAEAEEFVEAAVVGVVWAVLAVVPLAEAAGGVSGGGQGVGDGDFIEPHDFFAVGDPGGAGAEIPSAGEEAGSGGGAHGADEEAVELGSRGSELVHGGRVDFVVTVGSEVAPALVVSHDEDDAGSGCGF